MNFYSQIKSISLLLAIAILSVPAAGQTTGGQSLYNKPFIMDGTSARVGGYFEHQFIMDYNAEGDLTGMNFKPYRMVPFIFAEISHNLRFSTEIEFEYGGNPEKSGEIKIEYAVLDWQLRESLALRSGIILLPLGRFNLLHDSPVNDFTERPLVSRYILPSTFMESGTGIFGTLYPTEASLISYELYVVNGLGNDVGSKGLRSGRPHLKQDNNREKSFVGRVGFSPILGLEAGLSFYNGRYNDNLDSADVARKVAITALDWSYERGPFQFIGEAATFSYVLPSTDLAAGFGYYGQLNYHFAHGLLPGYPASVFTAMIRVENLDINEFAFDNGVQDQYRLSFGINFRPFEQTAFKLSVLRNVKRASTATEFDSTTAYSQVRASVATYF